MANSFSSQPKAYQDSFLCLMQRRKWDRQRRGEPMSHAKKQRRKGEDVFSFSSQPKAYQYQIATLSKEDGLTQRCKDAKKNANNGTGLR